MGFKVKAENPLPDICELSAHIEISDGGVESPLKVELSVFPHEIEDRIGSISVSVSEATLYLDLQGLEVVPKTKFGRNIVGPASREVTTETAKTSASTSSADLKVTGSSEVNNASGGASTALAIGRSKTKSGSASVKETETLTQDFLPVRAIGNKNWAIQAKPGEALNGTYIDYENLCEVRPIWGSNTRAFTLAIFAKEKHIRTDLLPKQSTGVQFKLPPNQKKIAGIVLAKTLHNRVSDAPYQGAVCLSYCEGEDEE